MLRYNTKDRSIFLTGEIKASTATALITKLLVWDKQIDLKNGVVPIQLYINSEGGEVQSGLFAIYDVIQSLFTPVETFCIGQAYSSAAVLVASGTGKRYIYPNASMMLHPPFVEIQGTKNEMISHNKSFQNLDSQFWKILAKHTKKEASQIEKECQQDRYFSSRQALKYGLVDHILLPKNKTS